MTCLLSMLVLFFLISADSALGQSVEIMSPSDGESIRLRGFAVSAVIHDMPNYDYVFYDIIVDVWDEANQEWAGNSSIHFNDKAIVQGRNVKVVVPDIYRFSKWPKSGNLPLLALVGDLDEEDHDYFPAKVGDKIRLDVIISIWEGGRFYMRGDYANLTVSGRGSYLTEKKQCIIFKIQNNCENCCN